MDGVVKLSKFNLFDFLVFFYFVTLSAETLNIPVFLYKFKATHILAVFLLGLLFLKNRKLALETKTLAPVICIAFSFLISSLGSVYPERSLGYFFIFLFNYFGYFLLIYNLILFDREKYLSLYISSFIVIGIYCVTQVALSFFGIYDPMASQRVGSIARGQGLSYEPSFYALYMTGLVSYYNAMTILNGNLRRSLFKLVFINLLLISSTSTGIFFSYPFFFVLMLLVSFFPAIRLYFPRIRRLVFALFLFMASSFALMGIFAYDFFAKSFYKFFDHGFTHWSFMERFEALVNSWYVFLENPWFGVGQGGVGPYLYVNKYNSGNFPDGLAEVELYDPMNSTTEILGSLGLFGFFAFSWLLWRVLKIFRESFATRNLLESDRVTLLSLFISLVVILFVLQFNCGLFRPYVWAHFSVFIGFASSVAQKDHHLVLATAK